MSRYINADKFYKDMCDSIDQMTSAGISVDGAYLWAKMQNTLENAPSIDIVRCKECRHRSYCYSEVHMTNKKQTTSICKDIDFCSYGERKESER